MQIPFFNNIKSAQKILIAGAGGGFDIASGIPLYKYLKDNGKDVVLANLSFSNLVDTNSPMICRGLYPVTSETTELSYFPEKRIQEWLAQQESEEVPMYAFSGKLGVAPLKKAYLEIIKRHNIDTLILADGGTDSLMFGDEAGVGTIIEDSISLIAASELPVKQSFLVATAFGIEYHHDLNHYACLENISTLIKAGAYQGCMSLTNDMKEGRYFIDLVNHLNAVQPKSMSIVNNAIASSMQGEFGDHHPTPKTEGSEQFINALMGLYWFFQLEPISTRIKYAAEIKESEYVHEVVLAYQRFRKATQRRPDKAIPL